MIKKIYSCMKKNCLTCQLETFEKPGNTSLIGQKSESELSSFTDLVLCLTWTGDTLKLPSMIK